MALQVSGFVSGLDVTTIVSQLMQSESYPQTMLKDQLSSVQADAAAYRGVNSKFAALLTAAQSLGTSSFGSTLTAGSTDAGVVASATTGATTGSSITFSVTGLAAAKSEISTATWASPTAALSSAGPTWPLTVLDASGKAVGTITVPAGATLSDAATAITNSGYGLTASLVQTGSGAYRLQVASAKTGTANSFSLQGTGEATADGSFTPLSAAADAELTLGGGLKVKSSSNTFASLLNGVSVTVSALTPTGGRPTTVSVGTDNTAITKQMQALVDAANAALSAIATSTDNSPGSTAPLAGDFSVQNLAQQVLLQVSDAVGASGSPAQIGLQLTRDGQITFDAAKFSSVLTTDPALAKQLVAGTTGVPGVASRLATLAKSATDSVTGTLTSLANGEDARAKDLQDQIDAWTDRLASRQEQLTTEYSNLQSMLSTLQSQQSWLSSMLSSSSSSSSSSKSSS